MTIDHMTTYIGGSKLLLIMFCVLSTEFQWKVVVDFWFKFSGGKPTRHKKKRTKSTERELFVLCHKKLGNKELLASNLPSMCFHRVCHKLAVSATRNMTARRICLWKVIWSSLTQVDEISRKPIPMYKRNPAALDQYSCVKLMYYSKRTFVYVAISILV